MRRTLLTTTVLLVLLLAVLAYGGWSLWQVRGDLLAAQADATRLQATLEEGDQPAAEGALADLQQHAGDARDGSDGPLVGALTWLPAVGDDVEGVRLVSSALDEVAQRGLPPLVAASAEMSGGAFLPSDGQVPLGDIRELQEPVATAADSFATAADTLAEGDTSGYVDQLRPTYRELRARIGDAADALAASETATELLPPMLGADGPRRYVAIFQNNAELRTTGGLPGAAALLSADDGRITMERQTISLPRSPQPVLPISKAEKELYEGQLGTFYQDSNFTPHFPRTAELVAAHWQRNFDQQVDGVLSLDPVALSYLLQGTGPVTVGGTEVTADNAVDLLLHEVYLTLGPEQQNVFFAGVARAVFEKVAAGEGDARAVLSGLSRGVREGRVMVTSFHDEEQQRLSGSRIAGEVFSAEQPAQLGVYLNDATMSKLNYFLDHEVQPPMVESCADGVMTVRGTLVLRSTAPEGGEGLTESILGGEADFAGKGVQLIQVGLHAPQGGGIAQITADNKKRPVWSTPYLDHDVAQTFIEVEPQSTHEVDFRMTLPAATTQVVVRVTPGVAAEDESFVTRVAC